MTAHRCAGGLKKKFDLRSGSQRHRHFVGFFNVPVLAPTRDQPFLYGDSDTPPHLVAFYDHAGDTEVHILVLTPRALTGVRDLQTENRTRRTHLAELHSKSTQHCIDTRQDLLQDTSPMRARGGYNKAIIHDLILAV